MSKLSKEERKASKEKHSRSIIYHLVRVYVPSFLAMILFVACMIIMHVSSMNIQNTTASQQKWVNAMYSSTGEYFMAVSQYVYDSSELSLLKAKSLYEGTRDSFLIIYRDRHFFSHEMFDEIESVYASYVTLNSAVEASQKLTGSEEILHHYRTQIAPAMTEYSDAVYRCVQTSVAIFEDGMSRQNRLAIILLGIMLGALIIFIASTLYALARIRRHVLNPIVDINGWARLFMDDYYEMQPLPVNRKDEIGELSASFNYVRSCLEEAKHLQEESEKTLKKLHDEEEYHRKYLLKFRDERREKDDLSTKAKHDGLTGLYNRRSFDDMVQEFLENKPDCATGALMIIDMDNFKTVNDTLGHMAGDEALKTLAGTMSVVFPGAYLGRYGGDEFVVFMTMGSEAVYRMKARELCSKMDRDFTVDGNTVHLSVSVGVVMTENTTDFSELYMRADRALYYAKEHGRNQFCLAEDIQL